MVQIAFLSVVFTSDASISEAQVQTQFLFHRETALTQAQAQAQAHAQGSKFYPFLVLALMLLFALQQVTTKYRSGTTQTQGYLPTLLSLAKKTLNADYLAPKQFGRFG